MKSFLYAIALLVIVACQKKEPQPVYNPAPKIEQEQTVHTDTAYEYEKRTGTSGHYEYTYEVFGTDANGNKVTGVIEIEGRNGTGVLEDANQKPHKIEVEWVGYGLLNATDENGNEYELTVTE